MGDLRWHFFRQDRFPKRDREIFGSFRCRFAGYRKSRCSPVSEIGVKPRPKTVKKNIYICPQKGRCGAPSIIALRPHPCRGGSTSQFTPASMREVLSIKTQDLRMGCRFQSMRMRRASSAVGRGRSSCISPQDGLQQTGGRARHRHRSLFKFLGTGLRTGKDRPRCEVWRRFPPAEP